MNRNDMKGVYGILGEHFGIQSDSDLDFVIGQSHGMPVGMQRNSSPEFRRRIVAAVVSYQFGLSSVDYALKRYVSKDLYEQEDLSLGNEISDYIRDCLSVIGEGLRTFHRHKKETFGAVGADITLFRIPAALDVARMLANRGLLLEVLPILRTCLEMAAWSYQVVDFVDDEKVVSTKASNCISGLKTVYPTAGKFYGYLSVFSHWVYDIHPQFLHIEGDRVGAVSASVKYRAMSLSICLVMIDILVVVIRCIYDRGFNILLKNYPPEMNKCARLNINRYLDLVVGLAEIPELTEIRGFLAVEGILGEGS